MDIHVQVRFTFHTHTSTNFGIDACHVLVHFDRIDG